MPTTITCEWESNKEELGIDYEEVNCEDIHQVIMPKEKETYVEEIVTPQKSITFSVSNITPPIYSPYDDVASLSPSSSVQPSLAWEEPEHQTYEENREFTPATEISSIGTHLFKRITTYVGKIGTRIIWAYVRMRYGAAVKETEKQWDHSTKGKVMEKYNLGMGSIMAYHCSGTDFRAAVSYAINGMTKSRFSHVTMVMPRSDFPELPILWQSSEPCACRLGGGKTRYGPDLVDLKAMIKEYMKGWPGSRFVFRPLKTALTSSQQEKITQYVDLIANDNKIYFPSLARLFWVWMLSNNPSFAQIANFIKLDCGVVKDSHDAIYCSMLITKTLLHIGLLRPPIKSGQYSPSEYGFPYDNVGQTPDEKLYGEEYEFIFEDFIQQKS